MSVGSTRQKKHSQEFWLTRPPIIIMGRSTTTGRSPFGRLESVNMLYLPSNNNGRELEHLFEAERERRYMTRRKL
jgi:hypothetical protein